MAHRSPVPRFGNWENEENVPYTAYFDKARKNRTGTKMNPNDPEENPDMFINNNKPPIQAPPTQMESLVAQRRQEAVRSKHGRHLSMEESDLRRFADSPLQHDKVGQTNGTRPPRLPKHERLGDDDRRRLTDSPMRQDADGRRVASLSPLHHHDRVSSGDTPKRAVRQSAGSEYSIDRSPLHPHYQTKLRGKGNVASSPSWERKGSSEGTHGLAPLTPGRSRLRSTTRGNDTPDHSAAVPKFGDWDESNPASADGYTHIFNLVREERHSGTGAAPVMPTENSCSNDHKQYGNQNSESCCCFPWGRR